MSADDKRKGGIAWSGSLVGSTNPANLGYRYTSVHKRYKRSGEASEEKDDLPSSIVIQFRNREGEDVGNHVDVPMESGTDEMGALVRSLLEDQDDMEEENSRKIPYAFYARIEAKDGTTQEIEITTSLEDFFRQNKEKEGVSTERVLDLIYQPLAVFRVRPVTRCTDTMPGHTEAVLHVAYSPDGRNLASGGGDTTVRFWDVNTSLPRHTCFGHKNHVLCTSWSPDGTKFASCDKNGVLMIWDPKTGKPLSTIKAHSKWITSMAWEPMHLSEGGQCERLVTSSRDSHAKIWNIRTKQCEATLSGHADSIECVKWSGSGWIYTASRDRTVKVWAADTTVRKELGKLIRTLSGHGHRVNALALSDDYICRTGPFDHTCQTFATVEEAYEASKEKYNNFVTNGGGKPERLISGSDDFTLFVWHPREGKHPVTRLTGHQQAVNHIAFSPDGRYFASASFDKKVKIWDGRNGTFLKTLTGHVGAVYQVAWSSDGRFLVSASKDSTAKLWEVPSGKRARETLPGHADEVYALDWSPNGSSVATGSKDRTIKIWKH